MEKYYTSERNAQIVIALLKANNIRKIIVSPGRYEHNVRRFDTAGSLFRDLFFGR